MSPSSLFGSCVDYLCCHCIDTCDVPGAVRGFRLRLIIWLGNPKKTALQISPDRFNHDRFFYTFQHFWSQQWENTAQSVKQFCHSCSRSQREAPSPGSLGGLHLSHPMPTLRPLPHASLLFLSLSLPLGPGNAVARKIVEWFRSSESKGSFRSGWDLGLREWWA